MRCFPDDKRQIHITITKNNVRELSAFFDFLDSQGVHRVGMFPADYMAWNREETSLLRTELNRILRKQGDKFTFIGSDWQKARRGAKRPPCNRIYLGADGSFYPCKCFSTLSSHSAAKYRIGSLDTGIDAGKRKEIFSRLENIVDDFESRSYAKSVYKGILGYIYCPMNTTMYALEQGGNMEKCLSNYYRLMIAFNTPFLRFMQG
jgi:hypothetical protein